MKRISILTAILALGMAVSCGGEDDSQPENLFDLKPECEGEPITALQGSHQMVISALQIGSVEDGFDLDGDGEPDNKMASIASLAMVPLEDSFLDYTVVIPMEFFDMPTIDSDDECVKFAVYAGTYLLDRDGDGEAVARDNADCNDHDAAVNRHLPEIAANGIDDNCNGYADEVYETTAEGQVMVPSTDTQDLDGDGVTIADGDCDDHNDLVLGPNSREICGDGVDNNCDGRADWALVSPEGKESDCSPYDYDLEELYLEDYSFTADGKPQVAFDNATITKVDGKMMLDAGPSRFSVTVPLDNNGSLNLELRITGAHMVGELYETPTGTAMRNARLGGILDANSIDKISGLEIDEIGLLETDTFLDATYANILGTLLALKRLGGDGEYAGCQTPDIDADGDGIEAFCDTDLQDDKKQVDACVDGDGTVVFDEVDSEGVVTKQCTAATDENGVLRFVDGISIELNFDTTPALLPTNI